MRQKPKYLYRIKIEFIIDSVLYPVGAVRLWEAKDKDDFEILMNKHSLQFDLHWEKLKW